MDTQNQIDTRYGKYAEGQIKEQLAKNNNQASEKLINEVSGALHADVPLSKWVVPDARQSIKDFYRLGYDEDLYRAAAQDSNPAVRQMLAGTDPCELKLADGRDVTLTSDGTEQQKTIDPVTHIIDTQTINADGKLASLTSVYPNGAEIVRTDDKDGRISSITWNADCNGEKKSGTFTAGENVLGDVNWHLDGSPVSLEQPSVDEKTGKITYTETLSRAVNTVDVQQIADSMHAPKPQ